GRYRSAYLRVVGLVLLLILPMMACAAAFADIVIPLAFGGKWADRVNDTTPCEGAPVCTLPRVPPSAHDRNFSRIEEKAPARIAKSAGSGSYA
ncbi:oligosaccharide flippase family protein, partial [Cereibacter sphaeroides]|uniref:oligosaccharide flippase family protein n=1 Tax=Cereibacter sphaeroides TaxID=1063 RepID=UPI001F281AEC